MKRLIKTESLGSAAVPHCRRAQIEITAKYSKYVTSNVKEVKMFRSIGETVAEYYGARIGPWEPKRDS